jgi:hypothetical protein
LVIPIPLRIYLFICHVGRASFVSVLTSALGHDYPTILAIRQSLGKSILKSHQPNLPSAKRQLLSFLTHLLQLLLPKSSTKDIESGCAKFVDKAVGLKNSMTEEQAVYRAYFFNSGKSPPFALTLHTLHIVRVIEEKNRRQKIDLINGSGSASRNGLRSNL